MAQNPLSERNASERPLNLISARTRQTRPVTEADLERLASKKAQEIVGEVQLSRAQERLRQKRAASKRPKITIVEDGDEKWFVRTLSLPLLHELSLRTPRDADGVLSLDSGDKYASFMAAVFFVCLVTSENDLTPYFVQDENGWRDAVEQADEVGEWTETNGLLMNYCLLTNPEILPDATNELLRLAAEQARQTEADVPPLVPVPTSETLLTTSPENGLPPTKPTSAPSSWPTDSSETAPPLDTSSATSD